MALSRRILIPLTGAALVAGTVLFAPVEASAQRRAVRRPPVRSVVYVRPVYYRPYYPFYGVGFFGYSSWSGWAYYGGWYPYPYPYPYYRDRISEARIQVEPKDAEVYIDGYLVGRVDDFDGWSQRLRVEPGEHVLEIYHPNYKTYRQPVLFRPASTVNIKHVMEPLSAGEASEPRPTPAPGARTTSRRDPPPYRPAEPRREPRDTPPPADAAPTGDYGAVAVRVQPADAEVIVDGERWDAPESGDLTLQLAEGAHHVEIRRDGYRPYSAEIRVRRGETTSLNVSLTRQ